jgi:hypothetical protein
VEPDPVGGDVTMTPWPIEQDVAYAGASHLNGSRTRASCQFEMLR